MLSLALQLLAVAASLALLGLAIVAVRRAWSVKRRDDRDAELAAERIAALRRLAELPPDELAPPGPDLTPGQRRALRGRQHPIAHKRAGRPI